nr:putative small lipoprotein YifL [Mucilaginibacter sp. X5P1]
MKKILYIAVIALTLGSLASCSNKLCPAYDSYPHHSR